MNRPARVLVALSVAAVALATSAASAAIIVSPAQLTVARSASAPLRINVTTNSGDVIDSVDVNVQVTGTTRAPVADIDFTSGTILSGGTKTKVAAAPDPFFPEYTYDGAAPVVANGQAFSVLFNTSSLALGSTFTVNFYNAQFPTRFSGQTNSTSTIRPSSGNAFTVTVVPEPATLAAVGAAGLTLVARRRRPIAA